MKSLKGNIHIRNARECKVSNEKESDDYCQSNVSLKAADSLTCFKIQNDIAIQTDMTGIDVESKRQKILEVPQTSQLWKDNCNVIKQEFETVDLGKDKILKGNRRVKRGKRRTRITVTANQTDKFTAIDDHANKSNITAEEGVFEMELSDEEILPETASTTKLWSSDYHTYALHPFSDGDISPVTR